MFVGKDEKDLYQIVKSDAGTVLELIKEKYDEDERRIVLFALYAYGSVVPANVTMKKGDRFSINQN